MRVKCDTGGMTSVVKHPGSTVRPGLTVSMIASDPPSNCV